MMDGTICSSDPLAECLLEEHGEDAGVVSGSGRAGSLGASIGSEEDWDAMVGGVLFVEERWMPEKDEKCSDWLQSFAMAMILNGVALEIDEKNALLQFARRSFEVDSRRIDKQRWPAEM